MNIRLKQPLPVIGGRVLPAGMVLDAPDPFKKRLVSAGKAVWADEEHDGSNAVEHTPVPPMKRAARKKV